MAAILYPCPVEKKRSDRIPCGISRFGTLKYSKDRCFRVVSLGKRANRAGPEQSRVRVIMLVGNGIPATGRGRRVRELCDLRKEKTEALLPGHARTDLSAVLW